MASQQKISNKSGTSSTKIKKAIFLSHEHQNKIFANNLFDELENRNLTTFFDQDRESLPRAERFPDKIIEGLRGCKLVVFLLSESFISKKWPMIELVESYRHFLKTKSPLLLPLFYNLRVSDIDEKRNKEGWSKWSTAWHTMAGTFTTLSNENITINPKDCEEALIFITKQNGLTKGSLSEHAFMKTVANHICEIVTPDIWGINDMLHHLKLSQVMHTHLRHIAERPRLLGMWGEKNSGKSTLANALCGNYFKLFKGSVQCVELEFECESILREVKNILRSLTNADWRLLDSITSLDQAINYLKSRIKGKSFFLAIDNIPGNERCRKGLRDLLVAIRFSDCRQSCVLLTARNQRLLESFLKECGSSAQPIQAPQLQDQKAIDIIVSFATSSEKKWHDYNDEEKSAIQSLCKSSPIYDRSSESFSPGEAKSIGLLIRGSTNETANDPLQWQTVKETRDCSGEIDQLFSQSIQRTLERAIKDKAKVQQSLQLIIDAALYEKAMGPTLNGTWRWLGIVHDITRTSVKRKFKKFKACKLIDWAKDDEQQDAETLDKNTVFDWPAFQFTKFATAEAQAKPNKWRWFYYDGRHPEYTSENAELEKIEKLALVRGDFKDVAEVVGLRRCVAVVALMMARCEEVQRLNVWYMKELQALEIENCKCLRKINGLEEAVQLKRVYVNCAPYWVPENGILDLSMLRWLRSVRLINTGMEKPPKISGCPDLRELYIERNRKLQSLPKLGGDLTSLSHISFADNPKVTSLPDLSPLAASLTHLSVRNCEALANIKTLESLTSLQCLNISSCKNLHQPLPDLSKLHYQSSNLQISARHLNPRTIEQWKHKGCPDEDALGRADNMSKSCDDDDSESDSDIEL